MVRLFLALVFLGFLAAIGGLVYLGGFPPAPAIHTVDKVLPNSGFKASGPIPTPGSKALGESARQTNG